MSNLISNWMSNWIRNEWVMFTPRCDALIVASASHSDPAARSVIRGSRHDPAARQCCTWITPWPSSTSHIVGSHPAMWPQGFTGCYMVTPSKISYSKYAISLKYVILLFNTPFHVVFTGWSGGAWWRRLVSTWRSTSPAPVYAFGASRSRPPHRGLLTPRELVPHQEVGRTWPPGHLWPLRPAAMTGEGKQQVHHIKWQYSWRQVVPVIGSPSNKKVRSRLTMNSYILS